MGHGVSYLADGGCRDAMLRVSNDAETRLETRGIASLQEYPTRDVSTRLETRGIASLQEYDLH